MTFSTRFMVTGIISSLLLIACTPDNQEGSSTRNDSSDSEVDNVANKVESRVALGTPNIWEPVPEDGIELGLGWDSREGRIVPNRCVRIAPIRSTGQTTVMALDEVSDRSDIMKSLNVSAAGSVKTMFASASGTASFAKSSKVSSQSTTLLLNATITNGTLFAGPAEATAPARSAFPAIGEVISSAQNDNNTGRLTLEPWALELMKKPDEFRAYCGDGFVSAITSGARLLATFTFSSSNAQDRQSKAATVKASYGPANLSTSASESNQASTSKVETHVRYMQIGGAKGPIATSQVELKDKLKLLAAEADDSPRFQDMRITPYSQMAEWRGSDAWRDTDDEYDIIAETYWQLSTLEEDIIYIIANYSDYNNRTGRNKAELKKFQDEILSLRQTIYSALSHETAEQASVKPTSEALNLFKTEPAATTFNAPSGINLNQLSKNPSLAQLAGELKNALPYGNASLLRINLPIPKSVFTTTNETDKADLQKAVINWYIATNARRACQNNPVDNYCLSNKELDQVASMVPAR